MTTIPEETPVEEAGFLEADPITKGVDRIIIEEVMTTLLVVVVVVAPDIEEQELLEGAVEAFGQDLLQED